jgi:hypothetical protein
LYSSKVFLGHKEEVKSHDKARKKTWTATKKKITEELARRKAAEKFSTTERRLELLERVQKIRHPLPARYITTVM